jgi:predicted regulator of Ras-like GTPase activity (Roadblock/LC7/MglB family)
MVKKKTGITETATAIMMEDDEPDEPENAIQQDETYTNLAETLAEINNLDGVLGYILRGTISATIDLKEPEKIVEYAILSSQAIDATREITELFNLGEPENILIQGKDIKTLNVIKGENKISIFMEKTADHADILERIAQ